MIKTTEKLLNTGLFESQSNTNENSIINDRRTAPLFTNISTCIAVSVTEPKPFYPIVGFEKNSNGKNAPIFSKESIGYEVYLAMPRKDASVKLVSLVVPTLEIANKIQFRLLYQLVNPRGKYKYKSFDVIELWADDIKEVRFNQEV